MEQNIFRLLYTLAGFMIMLMGLFNFFSHHERYVKYNQHVQEVVGQQPSWMVEVDEPQMQAEQTYLTYQELLIELGGYYTLYDYVVMRTENNRYETGEQEDYIQEINGFPMFCQTIDSTKIYMLNVIMVDENAQRKIILEVKTVKE